MVEYVCLLLPFPPSVNNLFVNNRRTGGRFPSKKYKAWQQEAGHALSFQQPLPEIAGPVRLKFAFGRPDKRRRDLSNYLKAPEDTVVAHGIISDDSLVEKIEMEWVDDVVGCRIEVFALAHIALAGIARGAMLRRAG